MYTFIYDFVFLTEGKDYIKVNSIIYVTKEFRKF
jgi:hypothetical protein